MASYWLSAAGKRLRAQIDVKYSKRDKRSDGWIGDASHQARPSDHNPDWSAGGVVRAVDIDADLVPKDGHHDKAANLANELRIIAKAGSDRGRLSYIIFQGKIASAKTKWEWARYSGPNAHNQHIHVSFTKAGDTDGSKFPVPSLSRNPFSRAMEPVELPVEEPAAPAAKKAPAKKVAKKAAPAKKAAAKKASAKKAAKKAPAKKAPAKKAAKKTAKKAPTPKN